MVLFSVLPSQRASETVDREQVRTGWAELWQHFSLWSSTVFCSPIKLITTLASGGEFLQGISSFLLFSTAEHLACCWDAFRCFSTVRGPMDCPCSAPWCRGFESPCSAWDPKQQTLCWGVAEPAMGRRSCPMLSLIVWGEVGTWVSNCWKTRWGDSIGTVVKSLSKIKEIRLL